MQNTRAQLLEQSHTHPPFRVQRLLDVLAFLILPIEELYLDVWIAGATTILGREVFTLLEGGEEGPGWKMEERTKGPARVVSAPRRSLYCPLSQTSKAPMLM